MTPGARLMVGVRKELRALAPMWMVAALLVPAAAAWGGPIRTVSILAYLVGSVALGAHAIGQEYTHRTLGVLLAQPAARRRLLLTKLGVLTPLLFVLTAVAWWTLFRDPLVLRRIGWDDLPSPLLVMLASLCLAPWLTMACRSTMAGVVFTLAVSPMLLVIGSIAGTLKYGSTAAAPLDRLTSAVHFWGVLALSPIGAAAAWHAFMRLEVIEAPGREFHLPLRMAARSAARTRHPIHALIAKELRLQQLTFVLFGLFALGGAALLVAQGSSEGVDDALVSVTILYTALVSILIGSLATAEERQFGTMDVQLLLPVAVWKQWIVKTGVALALAVTLGLVAPQLGTMFLLDGPDAGWFDRSWRPQALLVVILTSTSLYVSSLCSSGVRAAVLSLPAIFGIVWFAQLVGSMLYSAYRSPLHLWVASSVPVHLRDDLWRALAWSPLAMVALVSAVMLWLAFRNYRHGERSVRRIALQACCVAAVIALVLTAEFIASTAAVLR